MEQATAYRTVFEQRTPATGSSLSISEQPTMKNTHFHVFACENLTVLGKNYFVNCQAF